MGLTSASATAAVNPSKNLGKRDRWSDHRVDAKLRDQHRRTSIVLADPLGDRRSCVKENPSFKLRQEGR